jgi:hypothetical protein
MFLAVVLFATGTLCFVSLHHFNAKRIRWFINNGLSEPEITQEEARQFQTWVAVQSIFGALLIIVYGMCLALIAALVTTS